MRVPAFIDSGGGLFPCHAVGFQDGRVLIEVTAARTKAHGFRSGETWSSRTIVPRDKVKGRKVLPYDWADYADKPEGYRVLTVLQ